MKKILLTFAAAVIISSSYAQLISSKTDFDKNISPEPTVVAAKSSRLKKADTDYLNDINIRAVRDFTQRFKETPDVKWYKLKNGYVAQFFSDSIQTRADYNMHGHWLITIRYYKEKEMPRDIRSLIKSTYFDYTIMLVKEINGRIEGQDKIVYEVQLEDASTLKTIRVFDGETEVIGDYKKG